VSLVDADNAAAIDATLILNTANDGSVGNMDETKDQWMLVGSGKSAAGKPRTADYTRECVRWLEMFLPFRELELANRLIGSSEVCRLG